MEIQFRGESMNKEQLLIGIQELIDETYSKGGHYTWLNGKACELYEIVKKYGDNWQVQFLGEVELAGLAKEFEDYKNSRATYNTFGGEIK